MDSTSLVIITASPPGSVSRPLGGLNLSNVDSNSYSPLTS